MRPVLSAAAAIKLQEFYLSLREKHGNSESTPVTTRSVDITIASKSEPHTQRERDARTHTYTHTDRQTDRQIDRQTDRQTDMDT